MADRKINPLAMSDEEFMQMNGPSDYLPEDPKEEEEEQQADDGGAAEGESDDDSNAESSNEEDGNEDGEGTSGSDDDANDGDGAADTDGKNDVDEVGKSEDEQGEPEKKAEPESQSDEEPKADEPKEEPASDVNYEAFYKQVMAPFKANGKTIELKDPAEVIQLMQMGANYTRKLQDIQPHRKMLLMLQNNDLLDEGKLSYLIDLDKKNPEAIKKLIKDSGIDPLDIDTTSEPDYTAGSHTVTDDEARFHEVLNEVASSDTGKGTIALINSTWDQASKEVIWAQPEVMTVIHQQRDSGVYDLITAEMDRQKTLGKINPNTPFLQAYKQVGDVMAAAGAFGTPNQQQNPDGNPVSSGPQKLAERPAVPKPKAANGDRAKAASNPRGSSNPSKPQIVNPLAMSDEEFMKLDALRNRL